MSLSIMETLPNAFFREGAFVSIKAIKYKLRYIRLGYSQLVIEKTSIAKYYLLSLQKKVIHTSCTSSSSGARLRDS